MSPFVHLHVHSEYSLLNATCRLRDLVRRGLEFDMPALALTDMGNMFGAIEFYDRCKRNGIKPILGCDIYIAPKSRFERVTYGLPHAAYTFVLLCKNKTGYLNLMKLVTAGYLEGFYYKPRIDKELLKQHHEGLIGLSGSLSGEIPHLLNIGQIKKARAVALDYQAMLGKENFYLELQDSGRREEANLNAEIRKLSKELQIRTVVTSNVHYMNRKDAHLLDVLKAIQDQNIVQDRSTQLTTEYYFKPVEDIQANFKEDEASIECTKRIADQCNLELDLKTLHLPHFDSPKGKSQKAYLRELVMEGLKKRYPVITPEIQKRVDLELSVISRSRYDSYFLIVWDFVRFARERDIPVGPGRGSAAGSVVSYGLGITDIDPLRYGLLFERFLNPERVSMPDIDIDFCYEKRDQVIAYVTEKYSKENVAQIITFGTMLAKGVIRDVGRVMGIPYGDVDRIAKLVPTELNISIKDALEQEPQLKQLVNSEPKIAELIEISKGLEGLCRHASTHAAGVVMSGKPLLELLPLFKTGDGQISTMYPMTSLEKIGVLKMDFLGLRTLTVIDDTLKIIKRIQKKELRLEEIAIDDHATFKSLSRAKSIGVFQLESSGMRDILKKLKPDKFEDLIAVLALFRPGPIGSGMVDDFIKRKSGHHKIRYDHPSLEPILKDTYGIIVYQEQIMKIVNALAGFSLAQADNLRRAISKKKPEIIEQQKKFFMEGCKKGGVNSKTADKIFQLIMYFAGYGFNKSHSAAYAMISYRTAYLKTHFPVEFMTALLSSEKDNTDKVVQYIDESRRMGLKVLPSDVNESFPRFTVVSQDAIRFGLAAVKNVGQAAIDSVIQARIKHGRFKTLFDFTEWVDSRAVNRKTVESLIKCGAFDSLSFKRSQLMAVMDQAISNAIQIQRDRQSGQMSLFDTFENKESFKKSYQGVPDIPEWDDEKKLAFEKELLGFYVTGHPLEKYKGDIKRFANVNTATLYKKEQGDEVMMGAIVNKLRFTVTRRDNERMAIATLEDGKGSVEALVFPRSFKVCGQLLVPDAVLFFKAQVSRKDGDPKLLVQEIFQVGTIRDRMTRSVVIEIKGKASAEENLQRLQETMSAHSGQTPVYLKFVNDAGKSHDVIVDRSLFVRPDQEFIQAAEGLVGQGNVVLQV